MIDLAEERESQKPQGTYVPEINESVFTKQDRSDAIIKELDLERQNGVARLYFGDTRLNTESSENGEKSKNLFSFAKYSFNPVLSLLDKATTAGTYENTISKALARGVVNIAESAAETRRLGESYFYNLFAGMETSDNFNAMKFRLDSQFKNGEITKEQYDDGVKLWKEELDRAIRFDINQQKSETKKVKQYYDKMALWNARVSKHFARTEEENKGVKKYITDMFESAPSSLATLAAYMYAGPLAAAVAYGATGGTQEIASIAKTELEQGATIDEAISTTAVTAPPVMALDYASDVIKAKLWLNPVLKNVTKSRMLNTLRNFIYKNRTNKNIVDSLGTIVRGAGVSSLEEGVTETAQGVLENNLPRIVGYGPEFNGFFNEMMDYIYQGIVGGGMGLIFGGFGTAVALHNTKQMLIEVGQKSKEEGGLGLKKEEAMQMAEEVAPVLVSHAEAISDQIKRDVENKDISEPEARKVAQMLMGGLPEEDNSKMVSLLENTLNEQYPQGKGNANTIVARMLYVLAKQASDANGSSIEEEVTNKRIQIVDDPSSLDLTDKFYNARNAKGEVVGATSKNVTDNIIYLLNNATPDVLVHETTHLFLNTITAMLRSGKVNARFSSMIGNVLDFIGAPEGENYSFSEVQQEKLANMFQEIAKTGVAPTAELEESFTQLSTIVASAYNSARKTGQLTPQSKQLFADFFSSRKADSNIPVTVDDIARLQEAVQKIARGERVAVKDLRILRSLLRWKKNVSPIFVGYSVADFIKEHPEYNELDNVGKLQMLQDAGFDLETILPEGTPSQVRRNENISKAIDTAEESEEGMRSIKDIEKDLSKALDKGNNRQANGFVEERNRKIDVREKLVLDIARAKGWRGEPTTTAEGQSKTTNSRYITLTKGGTSLTVRLSDHKATAQGEQQIAGNLFYQDNVKTNAKELQSLLDRNDPFIQQETEAWKGFLERARTGEIIQDIEARADEVFLATDSEAQERRKEVQRYRSIDKIYNAVIGNNIQANFLGKAINALQRNGYVVTDKASMKQLATDLAKVRGGVETLEKQLALSREQVKREKTKAKEKVQKVQEQVVLKNAKDFVKNSLPHMEAVVDMLAEAGVNVDAISNELAELSAGIDSMSSEELITRTKNLLQKTSNFSNAVLQEYYHSEAFIQQEGIQPPIVKEAELQTLVANVYARTVSKTGKPFDYRLFEVRLSKALRKFKVPERFANLIMAELRKSSSLQGKALTDAMQQITTKVSEQYRKMMAEKYDKRFSELREKAKKGNLFASDNIAVLYIDKQLKRLENAVKDKKSKSERQQAVEDVLQTINFNTDVIGKDEQGNDAKLNEQQKIVANAFISQKAAQLGKDSFFPNEALLEGYQDISSFTETTMSAVEQLLEERQLKFNEIVERAYLTVTGRKELPKALKSAESGFVASLFGGLRSNLVMVFGEEFANEYDVTKDFRIASIRVKAIKDRVADILTKNYFRGNRFLTEQYIGRLDQDKPFAKSTDRIGSLLKDYTRGQILDLYLIARRGKIEAGFVSDKELQTEGDKWIERTFGKYSKEVIDRVIAGISKIDVAYGDLLTTELDAIYKDLAEAYYKINGRPMGHKHNYWPLYTMMANDHSAPIKDDLYIFNAIPTTKTELPQTQQSTGPSTDPDVNPNRVLKLDSVTEKFSRYLNTVSKFVYVVPKLNTLSEAIFGESEQSKKLQKAIADRYGEGVLNAIRKDFAYNLGVMPYEEISTLYKVAHEMLNNYIFGMLFKTTIAIKQSFGVVLYSDTVPWLNFFPRLLEGVLVHPFQTWNEMMSLPSVKNRFTGELPMALTQEKSFTTSWLPNLLGLKGKLGGSIVALLKKLRTFSSFPTRGGDALAVVYGGWAYMKAREAELENDPYFQALSPEEKREFLENELIVQTETTQQSGFGPTKGALQRAEGGGQMEMLGKRMFMIFTSFNVQIGRRLREGVYEYMNGNMTKGQLAKRASVFLILNSLLYSFFTSPGTWLTMLRRLIDGDEKWEQDFYLTVIRPMLDNLMSIGGTAGEIPMFFADLIAEKAGQHTYGNSVINMTPFFIENIGKKFGKKNKDAEDWLDAFLAAAQGVSAVPLAPTKQMIKSAVNMAGGKDPAVNLLMLLGYSEKQAKQVVGK